MRLIEIPADDAAALPVALAAESARVCARVKTTADGAEGTSAASRSRAPPEDDGLAGDDDRVGTAPYAPAGRTVPPADATPDTLRALDGVATITPGAAVKYDHEEDGGACARPPASPADAGRCDGAEPDLRREEPEALIQLKHLRGESTLALTVGR
jgi:hypothetical protein